MTMTSTTIHTFAIPSDNMGDLVTKFTKLARRARRLSLPEPTFHQTSTERKVLNEGTSSEKVILLHHIVVHPGVEGVSVSGWTFAAVLQHMDGENILSNISGDDLPIKYRTCNPWCDHCATIRNRKDTFVVKNETTGEYKQVGRSCLSDFFGHDALMYAEQAQYLVDLTDQCKSMEDWCGGGSGPYFEKIEKYLGHVAECIAKEGWLSRGKAREQGKDGQATADVAFRHMDKSTMCPLYTEVSEESHKLAASAIEWAEGIEGEEINEYLHNIRTIARSGVCGHKTFGMAASIVSSYQREVVKALELKRLASLPPSQHVGEVGEKIIVEVIVEKVLTFDNEYGTTKLHIMSDRNNGNRFIWWCSGEPFETGAVITICGNVKKHDTRNDVKQTVLTRCVQVELKTFHLVHEGRVYEQKVICEADFKKMAKEALGIKRWSKDLKVVEGSISL